MNYAALRQYDVANGPGVRVSIFVSGCTHKCKGCFNREAWDFGYGEPFTDKTIEQMIEWLGHPHCYGLTLLGGEPFEPCNQTQLLRLVRRAKEIYPDKTIWCYTGYDFERDILSKMYCESNVAKDFLSYLDVLVDGKFVERLKDLNLRFKGSSNQRIILVQESLQKGQVILWDPEKSI